VTGLAKLVEICRKNNICLVHFSSDYVFDGETPVHTESEPFSPLGVYGQTKAAGDILVGTLANHYILRTSWLIGSESSFVRTMMRLAAQGASPDVVNDQFGRLTFTPDLAAAALHLLAVQAPFGVYNASNSGPVTTWHEVARQVFEQCGRDPNDVRAVTTAEYLAGRAGAAPRPQHSVFDLRKLNATGFRPRPWKAAADDYPASLQEPRNAH
ncbi:MAG: NAD(P)-dependent oxidoreductase, partial [Bifidobacteriaceae bacterium]|nr:NAD(P)-dependent oxidoreductase [Bifidobacteriaceae bacterium]